MRASKSTSQRKNKINKPLALNALSGFLCKWCFDDILKSEILCYWNIDSFLDQSGKMMSKLLYFCPQDVLRLIFSKSSYWHMNLVQSQSESVVIL